MTIGSPIIDFHSHILSGVDHGCRCTGESIKQLALMRSCGTDIVVATPHFYPHTSTVDTFLKKADRAIDRLMQSQILSAPKLCVGAEVLLCDNLCSMPKLDRLCIRGTRVLLVELPTQQLNEYHYDTVEELIAMGYTVLLAHIDRYIRQYSHCIEKLLDLGAIAQINAESLKHFGVRKRILGTPRIADSIHAIGSDLHGVDIKLYKNFATADKYLRDRTSQIMSRSAALLETAEIIHL